MHRDQLTGIQGRHLLVDGQHLRIRITLLSSPSLYVFMLADVPQVGCWLGGISSGVNRSKLAV